MSPRPPPPKTQLRRAERAAAAAKLRRAIAILWTAFSFGVLASVVFLTAMSVTGWVSVVLPPGTYRNSTHSYVLRYYGGLWRTCWEEWDNSSSPVMHSKKKKNVDSRSEQSQASGGSVQWWGWGEDSDQ